MGPDIGTGKAKAYLAMNLVRNVKGYKIRENVVPLLNEGRGPGDKWHGKGQGSQSLHFLSLYW